MRQQIVGDKSEEKILADWLQSAKRQVILNGDKTSAFISYRFNASLETVWNAWTDLTKLSIWFAKVRGDIQEGNEIAFDVGAPHNIIATILKLKPRQEIRFTWFYPGRVVDEIDVRFPQDANSTFIELEQYSTDKSNWWYGAGSGWESALVRLSLLLSGIDPKSISNDKLDEVLGPLWLIAGNAISTIENRLV